MDQDVANIYQNLGSKLIESKCQNMTDSEKALRYLIELCEEKKEWKKKSASNGLVVGAFGGRMDHTLNNLSLLVRFTEELDEKFTNFNLYMLNEAGLAVIIRPGRTKYIRSNYFESHKGLGLFPLNGPCKSIKTEGLKWNLGIESLL